MINETIVLVYSGYNERAVVSFLRTLTELGVPYYIMARDSNDQILQTDYANSNVTIRKNKRLDVEEFLINVDHVLKQTNSKRCFMAPTTEALNRFLLRNRDQIEENKCIVPLCSEELYKTISDKYSFGELCKKYSINIPSSQLSIENISLPSVAKPYTYLNSEGISLEPILLFNNKDLLDFNDNNNIEDYYYQEYIGGESIYLLYYRSANGTLDKFSQTNYIQQPNGKSIVGAKSSDYHNKEISLAYEELLESEDFRGIIMIEIKEFNHKFFMIEANPRFWGPSQLFVDADCNFFCSLLSDYKISKSTEFKEPKNIVSYFWYGGILDVFEKGKELTFYQKMNKEELFNSLSEWLKADVYKRKDTINIYNKK